MRIIRLPTALDVYDRRVPFGSPPCMQDSASRLPKAEKRVAAAAHTSA